MDKALYCPDISFFYEGLRTFPTEPHTFEATFNAFGISCPLGEEESTHKEYMQNCRSKGVIPYCVFNIESEDNGVFNPSLSAIETLSHDREGVTLEEIVNGLLRREKFYRIIFKQDYGFRGLKNLKEKYLWNLNKEGYILGGASLHFGDTNRVELINWGGRIGQKIRVVLDRDFNSEEAMDIASWLNHLKEKFPDSKSEV